MLSIFHNSIPVSYTHLDVYKRQPLYKSTPVKVYMTPEEADNLEEGAKLHLKYTMNGKLDVKVEYMFDEEKQETEVSFDSIPAVFPTPVGAVSYTHLDVYKRQGLLNW